MIRLANQHDLDDIMVVVKEVIKEMRERESIQWSADYPKRDDFSRDLDKGELYVFELDGKLMGMCTFSESGHEEYVQIPFTTMNALTIKRLAVSPKFRKNGVSQQFINEAIRLAKDKQKQAINGDTFKNNPAAQRFFLKHGFHKVAERVVNGHDVPLYYYELRLI